MTYNVLRFLLEISQVRTLSQTIYDFASELYLRKALCPS